MTWIWAALMPHPPILVPEVGHGREREAAITLDGIEQLIARLAEKRPDYLFVLSPHQPYAHGALFLNTSPRISGSLAPFGAPSVVFNLKVATGKVEPFVQHLTKLGITVRLGETHDLSRDQGSFVPLYFLEKAWGDLPPLLLASPIGLDLQSAFALGEALSTFGDGATWGLLASGDLSHRLTPAAPSGYSPSGKIFDEAIVAALSSTDPEPLLKLSPTTLEEAGECGLRSALALLGLCRASNEKLNVLSYEGPFGVGYCNALAMPHQKSSANDATAPHPYVQLARTTVERFLRRQALPSSGREISSDAVLWNLERACFVSIKTSHGDLRGCIGTILPARTSLDLEIIDNAISASTRDPRFLPITVQELGDAVFSVDVLGLPEQVSSIANLDPSIWGVIVSRGHLRGVLLPDLEGVETVDQQLSIAARKAGLRSLDGAIIERFRVVRYKE